MAEPTATDKPELMLKNPTMKSLKTFLIIGGISSLAAGHEIFELIAGREMFLDIFTLLLVIGSAVFMLSLVVANLVTERTLVIYPKGFVLIVNKKAEFCRWDDVVSVERKMWRNGEVNLPRATYWIHDSKGREFELHDFRLDHTDCFCEWYLVPRVRERLLNEALALVDSGQEAKFGAFAVTQDGIRYKKSFLAWQDIAEIVSDLDGDLVVKRKGAMLAWCSPSTQTIPNLFVMLELITMRYRSKVLVNDEIMNWWSTLPQKQWHKDFGSNHRPIDEHATQRPWQRKLEPTV